MSRLRGSMPSQRPARTDGRRVRRGSAAAGLVLAVENVDLHRGDRHILRNVSWRIAPGERWVLSGPNGSGKTQLLKLCAGSVWPDPEGRGRISFRSTSGRVRLPFEAMPRIAYVGPERQDRYERYGWNFTALEVVDTGRTRSDIPQGAMSPRARSEARAVLRSLGIARLAARRFLTLSYGERRLVLVARAVATRPALLLLDETLGGLDSQNRGRLMRWLARDAKAIPAWVLATHRSEEIPSATTHALFIEGGRVRDCGPIRRRPRSLRTVVLRDASRVRASRRGELLVELRHADVHVDYHRVLHDIELRIHAGECWVVHGANGSGKSTLLRTIFGDHAVALGGVMRRRGIVVGVPLAQFRRWCAFVAPHLQSDPPRGETVLETIVSGLRNTVGLDGQPTLAERRRAVVAARMFGLENDASRVLSDLSYGQVRRVLFARALVRRPKLLLLDEALGGIDADTRVALRALIEAFVMNGGAVVMSSHHMDEWPDCATSELELGRGRVIYRGAVRARPG